MASETPCPPFFFCWRRLRVASEKRVSSFWRLRGAAKIEGSGEEVGRKNAEGVAESATGTRCWMRSRWVKILEESGSA